MTQDEFILAAQKRHGDRYDYTKSVYSGSTAKVTITCKLHGDYETLPHVHLKGSHCAKCSGKARLTREEFIEKAKSVHGDKYDYSKVDYRNNSTKVEIICPKHGSFFPKPINHIGNKSECPACKNCQRTTLDSFTKKAKEVHGDKYDYSLVVYRGVDHKVEIICPEHGAFWQIPFDHIKGRGCTACGIEKCAASNRQSKSAFIKKATAAHGNEYDYSKAEYTNSTTKIKIICSRHGPFWQTPQGHIDSTGCPMCSSVSPVSKEEFIKRAIATHGDKYVYTKTQFSAMHQKALIACRVHGDFWTLPKDHIAKRSGCPACAREQTSSAGENELAEWLKASGFEIVRNDRSKLAGFEMDIFIPAKQTGIEFNGAYWHSEDRMQHPRLHETKAARAEKAGIQLITVWDFDWQEKPALIKNLILHRLNQSASKKINARACRINPVDSALSSEFYDKTHIQGAPGRIICNYGLFFQEVMIACMSFSKASSRRGKTGNDEWELIRYSTNGIVRGGASRLFKAFINDHAPDTVWSFSDRQHFNGSIYPTLGFENDGKVAADYRVYHQASGRMWHKSAWQRKHIQARLNELGINEPYDAKTDPRTERDMQKLAKAIRIMDSGKIRWKWTKKP